MRLRLNLLKIQYDFWKKTLPLPEILGTQVQSQIVSICHNPEFRKKWSIDLIPKNIKNSYFCPFWTAGQYEKIGNPRYRMETEFVSRSMTYPSGRATSHILLLKFLNLFQLLPENFQHTQWRMSRMKISEANFIRNTTSKSFYKEIVYKTVGFKSICATISRQYSELFYNIFFGAAETVGQWRLQFWKKSTHQCTRMSHREKLCFSTKTFKMSEF